MILVAGATGVLGSEIVHRLCARGHAVRALVRPSSAGDKVARLRTAGAGIIVGDVRDRASLDAACHGVDAVICTVSMIATAQAGDSFADTDDAGVRNLVDAAAAAGASRFVYLSFDHERTPDSPFAAAKRAGEAHLRASGIRWTALRPGLFMESWLSPALFADPVAGTARIYGDEALPISYVSVADVAEVAIQSLTRDEARDAVVSFGGPEPVSQREAVAMFEQAFGRPFAVSWLPAEALEAQWSGATDPFARSFASLMLGVARGLGTALPRPDLPTKMTSVRDYVTRLAASPR